MKKGLIIMLAVLLLFCGCGENKSDKALQMMQEAAEESAAEEETEEEPDADAVDGADEKTDIRQEALNLLDDNSVFIISGFDTEEEQLTVKSLATQKRFRYHYTMSTRFLNKYGDTESQSSFKPGMVVALEKDAHNLLSTVTLVGEVWFVDDLRNYSIDSGRNIFTIGQTRYRLSDLTTVFVNDKEASIGDIKATDVLRVVGWEKDIISISVTTGHGYLALVNTYPFADTLVSIGGKIHTRINSDTIVELTAGEYVVTAAKDGYGGSATVVIESNEQTVLDMSLLKGEGPKKCKIDFVIEAEDARVYIDHEEVDADETVDVTYGQHRLRIVADGYEDWEKTLVVNSPSAVIELSLVADGSQKTKKTQSAESTANESKEGTEAASASSDSAGGSDSGTDQTSSGNTGSTSSASESTTSGNTGSTSASDSSSTGTTTEDRRQAEIDYLTTLSNMITSITGN